MIRDRLGANVRCRCSCPIKDGDDFRRSSSIWCICAIVHYVEDGATMKPEEQEIPAAWRERAEAARQQLIEEPPPSSRTSSCTLTWKSDDITIDMIQRGAASRHHPE